MHKTYFCYNYPALQVGPMKFVDGRYSTDDENLQAQMEGSFFFGSRIHVAVTEEDESLPPPRRSRPRAVQGARDTVNMSEEEV